mgnify:CR=1 FL=1|tara:strand:+ start:1244 stop:3052 length:1809 start_codon:yes stop_codon:yes gene_type:complete
MATINGTVEWGQIPLWYGGYEMETQQYAFASNYVVSANMPMIYQVIWTDVSINEQSIPNESGDVVNCIFHVLATTEYPLPAAYDDWDTIATVRKTRDIPNTNVVNSNIPQNQRYTIDVSKVVQDQLSYSLPPIGKGSWQSQEFGGLNGGETKQDNITEAISPYNVTRNGAYRAIKVHCTFEQLDGEGNLITSETVLGSIPNVRVVNSVPDFKSNTFNYQMFMLNDWGPAQDAPHRAMSNCPNHSALSTSIFTPGFIKKRVRSTDQAEWLYFFIQSCQPGGYDAAERFNLYEVYGVAYNKDGSTGLQFVLGSDWAPSDGAASRVCSDISHSFAIEPLQPTWFEEDQYQIGVQNVAPAYINSHAYTPQTTNYPYTAAISPITADTDHYKLYVRGVWYDTAATSWLAKTLSSTYWYKIDDQEQQSVYEHVKFHWLNTVGGIDSYTATRNVMESLSVDKSLITGNLPGRRYHQTDQYAGGAAVDNGDYINDTMRGWDTYKGGQEVLSVNAHLNNKVYTEPLNKSEAKWLREIFASPNVWIETPTDGSEQDAAWHENELNPYLRPVTTQYTPVIITNSDITSLDQENGLVQFNIEYTLSQGVLTQRN